MRYSKMESTTCEPSAKPHGKRPPGAQRWRRKQTTPKTTNMIRDAWVTLAKRCEDFNFPEVTGLIMNAIATSTLALRLLGARRERPRDRAARSFSTWVLGAPDYLRMEICCGPSDGGFSPSP